MPSLSAHWRVCFQAACMLYDVDIICISVTEKLPFFFKRAPINGVNRHQACQECYHCPPPPSSPPPPPPSSSPPPPHSSSDKCVCVCVEAIDRGVVFEVSYSAAIRDSTMRRYTITNATCLMESCKGKVGVCRPAAAVTLRLVGLAYWCDVTRYQLKFQSVSFRT